MGTRYRVSVVRNWGWIATTGSRGVGKLGWRLLNIVGFLFFAFIAQLNDSFKFSVAFRYFDVVNRWHDDIYGVWSMKMMNVGAYSWKMYSMLRHSFLNLI